ncbi:MAG TPA: hypothetical protein DCY14_04565, partial [Anaerolineae bacterium]|nr:hypothetical protein [Anaerolineae bacterium]
PPIRWEATKTEPCVMDAIRVVQTPPGTQILSEGRNILPMVSASGQSLVFVFRNLLENAVDAMEENGKIKITGMQNAEWVDISVSDTGRGIPAELHEQIFELAHSSRTHPGKMGFGLWWVKTLMTRLGGSVTVESDGTHGTTFHLRLPIAGRET